MQEWTEIHARILRKLVRMKKWGASHTEERNAIKVVPIHKIDTAKNALEELIKAELILWKPSTYERHVSLNPTRKNEIMETIRKFFGVT